MWRGDGVNLYQVGYAMVAVDLLREISGCPDRYRQAVPSPGTPTKGQLAPFGPQLGGWTEWRMSGEVEVAVTAIKSNAGKL